MSTDRETTRIVRAWLEEGAMALPDRVLDAVLDQIPATPQRRSWWPARAVGAIDRTNQAHALRVPRRYTQLNGLGKWAVAAVMVAMVGGLAFVVLQPRAVPNVAAPVAPTSAPKTAAPSGAGLPSGKATAVDAGSLFTCAIPSSNGVKCWGYNRVGQLGNGTIIESKTPVDVLGLSGGVSAIAAGAFHTCALTPSGGVRCWGWNSFGQLGDGTITQSSAAVDVVGLTGSATALAIGTTWSCALTSAGGVACWGSNGSGELGNGNTDTASTPVDVTGLASGVTAIAAGGSHTCALTNAGGVKCWGNNEHGQLGGGSTIDSATPVDVQGLTSGVSAIAAGGSNTCALTNAGGVKCWGNNGRGQLGNASGTSSSTPVDIGGLTNGVTAIAAGTSGLAGVASHICALMSAGELKCWGANNRGQLGNGTTTNSSSPVDVSGLSGVIGITLGEDHSCALVTGGGVVCWGSNTNGRLGDGTTTDSSTPVAVQGL